MLLRVADFAVVVTAFVLALWAPRTTADWWAVLTTPRPPVDVLLAALYLALWPAALTACGLYQSYRLSAPSRESRDVLTAASFALLPLVAVGVGGCAPHLTPLAIGWFGLLAVAGLLLERRAVRVASRTLRAAGHDLRNVAVVGTGEEALRLTAQLVRRSEYGYRVVAVIECTPVECTDAHAGQAIIERIGALVDEGRIDEIYLALPLDGAQPLLRGIVARCEEQGVTARVASPVAALAWAHARVDAIEGQPIITVHSGPDDGARLMIKRALDVTGSAVGLVLLAPLFALVALAIKLDSPGPVFFIQERVGQFRRRIRVWKFRTMGPDAEQRQAELESRNEASGPVFKIAADPRVTRVGRVLRRTSIDELPQLINVLLGDMSLVGPRPLPVRDVERIDVRWHRRRFSVKPGITCLWQIESREPEFDHWIRLDMQYIDNWSLALDLKILARTIPAVLSGQGAH